MYKKNDIKTLRMDINRNDFVQGLDLITGEPVIQ